MKAFALVVYLINTSSIPYTMSENHSETFYADNYSAAYQACMIQGQKIVKSKSTGNYSFTCQNQ